MEVIICLGPLVCTMNILEHTVWPCSQGRNASKLVTVARVCSMLDILCWSLIDACIFRIVIMPPSALANLSAMDLDSPWTFKLRNPANSAASTHAGVLEFIAEEGCVHLPHWMMRTLRLDEGDPIRITGTELPKGKFVKLQPQQVHFLEVSDPKAVYVISSYFHMFPDLFSCIKGSNRLSAISQYLLKEISSRSSITR